MSNLVSYTQAGTTNPIDVLDALQSLPRDRWCIFNVGGRFKALIHCGQIKRASLLAGIESKKYRGRDALNLVIPEILFACATAGGVAYTVEGWDSCPPSATNQDELDLPVERFVQDVCRRLGERFEPGTLRARKSCWHGINARFPRRVAQRFRPVGASSTAAPPRREPTDLDIDAAFDVLQEVEPSTDRETS